MTHTVAVSVLLTAIACCWRCRIVAVLVVVVAAVARFTHTHTEACTRTTHTHTHAQAHTDTVKHLTRELFNKFNIFMLPIWVYYLFCIPSNISPFVCRCVYTVMYLYWIGLLDNPSAFIVTLVERRPRALPVRSCCNDIFTCCCCCCVNFTTRTFI